MKSFEMDAKMETYGVTSRQIAECCNIDRRTIQAWRSGKRQPKIGFIRLNEAIEKLTSENSQGTSSKELNLLISKRRCR